MENLFISLGIDWKIMILQSINFLILFVVIYKFLAKPLNNLLEERRKKIEEGLKLREESTLMISKINQLREEILTKAKLESEEIIKSAYLKRDDLLKKFNEEILKSREEFKNKFEIEKEKIRDQFYQELKKELPQMLEKFSRKVLGESNLNRDYIKKLIQENSNG